MSEANWYYDFVMISLIFQNFFLYNFPPECFFFGNTFFILGELDTTRPVPFRLTPNIIDFLNPVGISGPLTASMIATARCFVYPNFKVKKVRIK